MSTVLVGTGSGGPGTGQLSISLTFGGGIGPETPTIPTLLNNYSPGGQELVTLETGNNTITVPPLSGFIVIVPPIGNVIPLTLKGVNGDTGILFTGFVAMGFENPPPASIVVDAALTVSNAQVFFG